LPTLEDEIINIFLTPKTTPSFLIEALIDNFFTIGFGEHVLQNYISRNYMKIETENGYYVIYVDDLEYNLGDILDHVDTYIDDYEYVKNKLLMNLLKEYYETN
jgi:UDP-2,3-diacylglucosamine pyrophosphatase LpxH